MYGLDDLRSFVAIVERGGVTAAARAQGLSPGTISHRLTRIENHLGVLLMHRSSRSIEPSAEGQDFYARVVGILSALEDAELAIGGHGGELRGHLRVTLAPWILSRFILPGLSAFQERYAGLSLEFLAVDRYVNLVEERQDCAIRVGVLEDSGLLARRIADNHRVLCASPAYLARCGMPGVIGELIDHRSIRLPWQRGWGLKENIDMPSPVIVSNSDTLTEAAVNGLGIAMKSRLAIIDELRDGRLVEVLPGTLQHPEAPISSLRPANTRQSRKVDAFLEFVATCFADVRPPSTGP